MYQMPQNRENCVKSCQGADSFLNFFLILLFFRSFPGVGVHIALLLDLKKVPGSNLGKPFCVSFFETTQEIIPTENPPFYS
jgi:hypothetical protein